MPSILSDRAATTPCSSRHLVMVVKTASRWRCFAIACPNFSHHAAAHRPSRTAGVRRPMHPWFRFHKGARPNLSRNCGRQAARSSVASKKFDRIGLKNDSELLQHIDRSRMLLALKHSNVVSVDPCTVGKFLLRQVLNLAQPAKIRRNGLPQSHAEDVAGSLIYCHLIY